MAQSLTVYEAAQLLKYSVRHTRELLETKKLKGRKAKASGKLGVWLVDKESIAIFLEARKRSKTLKK
jgi:hypothetical protein